MLCDGGLVHQAVIWRKKVQNLNGSVSYSGAKLAGNGGDDATITVVLSEVPLDVHHIVFAMCIHGRKMSFAEVPC